MAQKPAKKRHCTRCGYIGFMTVHYPVYGGPVANPTPSGKLICPICGKTAKNHMLAK